MVLLQARSRLPTALLARTVKAVQWVPLCRSSVQRDHSAWLALPSFARLGGTAMVVPACAVSVWQALTTQSLEELGLACATVVLQVIPEMKLLLDICVVLYCFVR